MIASKFETGTYGPYLFGKQGPFLADDPPFVPCFVFWGDCGKLDSWHGMPSNPPSKPRHQHRADNENIALSEWPFLPLRGRAEFFANAAFFALRAHTARKLNSQNGL